MKNFEVENSEIYKRSNSQYILLFSKKQKKAELLRFAFFIVIYLVY